MACPVCGRLYCDHSPMERGQSEEEMMEDMFKPHPGLTPIVIKVPDDEDPNKDKK